MPRAALQEEMRLSEQQLEVGSLQSSAFESRGTSYVQHKVKVDDAMGIAVIQAGTLSGRSKVRLLVDSASLRWLESGMVS